MKAATKKEIIERLEDSQKLLDEVKEYQAILEENITGWKYVGVLAFVIGLCIGLLF